MLITLPERRASMCGPTARVQSSASVRLMSMMNRSSSSETPAALSLLARQRHQRLADGIAQRIHQHVDAPERGEHRINGAADVVRLRHVGNDRYDAPSGRRCDLRRRAVDVLRRQRIERDVGAGLGEHLRNALADAASGPCDEDDFSGDIEFAQASWRILHPG